MKHFFLTALFFLISFFLSAQYSPVDMVVTDVTGMMASDTIVPAGSSVYVLISPYTSGSSGTAYTQKFSYSVDGILQAQDSASLVLYPSYYYFYLSDYRYFGFAHRWQAPSNPGRHVMKIWSSNPNGLPDTDPSNDTMTINLVVKSNSEVAPRTSLWEGFTSTSCSPCTTYDEYLQGRWWTVSPNEYSSRMAFINYHTQIPGTDESYNDDVRVKMHHYAISGNPQAFVDNDVVVSPVGAGPYPDSTTLRKFADKVSQIQMDAEYKWIADSISVTVRFTPLGVITDTSYAYKLNVAIVEDSCAYGSFLQQYVFRKMLPGPEGQLVTLTPNVQQTFTFGCRLQTAQVTSGSYNLWSGTSNAKAVAFISNNYYAGKTLQAAIAHPEGWTGIIEEVESRLSLYPNPVNSVLNIQTDFQIQNVNLYTYDGQIINALTTSRGNVLSMQTNELPSGVYVLRITGSGNKVFSRKVIIEK